MGHDTIISIYIVLKHVIIYLIPYLDKNDLSKHQMINSYFLFVDNKLKFRLINFKENGIRKCIYFRS